MNIINFGVRDDWVNLDLTSQAVLIAKECNGKSHATSAVRDTWNTIFRVCGFHGNTYAIVEENARAAQYTILAYADRIALKDAPEDVKALLITTLGMNMKDKSIDEVDVFTYRMTETKTAYWVRMHLMN